MQYHVARGVYKKVSILSITLAFLFSILSGTIMPLALSKIATAAPAANITTQADLQAALSDTSIESISLGGDITITNTLIATGGRTTTILGNGHTITATIPSATDDAAFSLKNTTITISNLTIQNSGSVSIHGINAYKGVNNLESVSLKGFGKYGLLVNRSIVTVNNISTENNVWGGINVDQSEATPESKLIVNGTSSHNEIKHIFIDDITKPVSVVDSASQYDIIKVGNEWTYRLKPAPTPIINGENFNTHSGTDYKGINVGFNINDFGTVTDVTVDLYKDATKLATNTSNDELLTLINNGETHLSTPFIIENGTYGTETYWNLGAHTLNFSTKPTKAVVTVTGQNGTHSIELTPLTEPNNWTYESLIPPDIKPTNLYFTKTANDTNSAITCGDTVNWMPQTVQGNEFGAWAHWSTTPHTTYHVETYYKNGDSWTRMHNSNNSKPMPYRFYGLGSQGDGLYRIKVVAYNTQGGFHSDPVNCNLSYDATAPDVGDVVLNGKSVSIARDHNCGPTNFNPVSGKVDLSATITDNLGSVKSAQYKIRKVTNGGCTQAGIYSSKTVNMSDQGGDNWITLPSTKLDTTLVPADGNYTIQMAVKDSAGNETTKYIDITVDNTKPIISITPNAPKTVSGVASFDVIITDDHIATDKNKDVWVELYGNPDWSNKKGQKVNLSSGTGVFTVDTNTLPDGEYVFRVSSVVDAAGNYSGDKSFKYITVDNTAPAAPAIDSASQTGANGTAEANTTITIKDTDSNVLGSTAADGSGNWTATFATLPGTTIIAFATDAAGNNSPDSTPYLIPNASITGTGNENNSNTSNSNTRFSFLAAPTAVLAAQFNTNNPQVLGLTVDGATANADNTQTNQGKVKSTSVKNAQKEKELAEEASSSFAWYWILLLIAVAVALYYAYRNWRLNKDKA